MKIKHDTFIIMSERILKALKYLEVRASNITDTCDQIRVWSFVVSNIKYNDSNLNVVTIGGKRLFAQDRSIEFYPDNTNDKTLETALKKVFKYLSDFN